MWRGQEAGHAEGAQPTQITLQHSEMAGRFKGRVLVNGELASEAEMMCMITENKAES